MVANDEPSPTVTAKTGDVNALQNARSAQPGKIRTAMYGKGDEKVVKAYSEKVSWRALEKSNGEVGSTILQLLHKRLFL